MKKVIIYDFDGTFYSGKHKFDLVAGKVGKNKRKFLPDFNDEEYDALVKENPIWLEKSTGADIIDLIYEFKAKYPEHRISAEDFWNWQQQERDLIIIDRKQIVDAKYIESLCKRYPVYIVSNSSPNHLSYYLKDLGLNEDWFKAVISNRFLEFDRTKKHYYYDIMKEEGVEPERVFVIGDSKKNDLEPALLLNMNTAYLNDARTIPYVTNKLIGDSFENEKKELLIKFKDVVNSKNQEDIDEFRFNLIEVGISENELKNI